MQKTYKRETAVAMLIVMFIFFYYGLDHDRAYETAKYLSTPVFLFAAGAFGLDAWAKQL